MDLAEILSRHREQIIDDWAARLHRDVSPNYAVRPYDELRQTVSRATDANHSALADRDYGPIDAMIEWIGWIRSELGFSLPEVQGAFELYRTVVLPILGREMAPDRLILAMEQVNACLSYTLHRFSDHFQRLHEQTIREYSQLLELKVEERTRQLTESEAKYRTLVEDIQDGYFVNRQGRITFANPAFCAMHGYRPEEVVGREFIDFIAPESRSEIRPVPEDPAIDRPSKEQYVYFRLCKDGTVLPTENRVTLTTYEGKRAAIGICRDITARMEVEKRIRETESLTRIVHLSSSLAHEIRNPLSSAKMSIQMILKNPGYDGTDRRRLEILAEQVTRLERVVTEMLDLARPMPFAFAPACLAETIDHCLEALEARLKAKDVIVQTDVSPRLPPIRMDRERMEQAFVNLLLNSIEAVGDNGRIHLSAELYPASGTVRVRVSDNGCGIRPEDLPYIFDPFFSGKSKGTGLGLANVRRIVEAHRGAVEAGPEPGGGLCFSIELPLDPELEPLAKGSVGT